MKPAAAAAFGFVSMCCTGPTACSALPGTNGFLCQAAVQLAPEPLAKHPGVPAPLLPKPLPLGPEQLASLILFGFALALGCNLAEDVSVPQDDSSPAKLNTSLAF